MGRVNAYVLIVLFGVGAVLGFRHYSNAGPEAAVNLARQIALRDDVRALILDSNKAQHPPVAALDVQWKADAKACRTNPLMDTVLHNALSQKMAGLAAQSKGQIVQIMVMDSAGRLVAADHVTHDYDQSDEPKWLRTVGARAKDAVYEGGSPGRRGVTDQASQAVLDRGGAIIGAITVQRCRTSGGCN